MSRLPKADVVTTSIDFTPFHIAYMRGYAAGEDGCEILECPYEYKDRIDLAEQWIKGWEHGKDRTGRMVWNPRLQPHVTRDRVLRKERASAFIESLPNIEG